MEILLDYFRNKWPYTDFHELNADWLLSTVKELIDIVDEFIQNESISFADPILWNITTQYSKATVVLDTEGNAYLSKQPVPSGIQLSNSEYWQEIFNFTTYTRTANRNLTVNLEANTTRATSNYDVDDWLIYNDVLYKVTTAIAVDDLFVIAPNDNYNIIHFTVEDFCKAWVSTVNQILTDYNNTIATYKNDIDASELAYKNELEATINSVTNNLTEQLAQAIAGATVDSEVINARIGFLNNVYTTLGEAIRDQDTLLYSTAEFVADMYSKMIDIPVFSTDVDFWLNASGGGNQQAGYTLTKYRLDRQNSQYYYVDIPTSSSPCSFRFGSSLSGSASSVVGHIYNSGYRGIVKKPATAIAIFIAAPSDATVVCKEIPTYYYDDVLNYVNDIYTDSSIADHNVGFWLNANGGGSAQAGYTFDKYQVSPDELIEVDINYCASPVIWRFASTMGGSSDNVVGELHTTEYHGLVRVPATAKYLFVAKESTDNTVSVRRKLIKNDVILQGLCFVWAHNNKAYIKTTSNFTLKYKNTNVVVGTVNLSFNLSSDDVKIVFDGENILLNADQTASNEIVLANVIFKRIVSSNLKAVICNDTPLIDTWQQRTGIDTYINNAKLTYDISMQPANAVKGEDFYILKNRYDTMNTAITYIAQDTFSSGMVNDVIFYHNITDITGAKILTIGDSFVKRGWLQQQIKTHANVDFVGTQLSNYNNIYCEGYSGATAVDVLYSNSSPFYFNGVLNYSTYESTNNIHPDMIVIMFGLNETSELDYYTAVQNFINHVHAYDPDIKIYVVQPCTNSKEPTDAPMNGPRQLATYRCGVVWHDFYNCIRIPMRTTLVDIYDYEHANINYGYGVVMPGTHDCVHPSQSVGFKKIGDMIYNYLGV